MIDQGSVGDARFTGLLRAASAVLFGCAALAMLVHTTPTILQPFTELARFFAARQDMPVAAAAILFYVQFAGRARAVGPAPLHALTGVQSAALLAAIALAAWALRTQVLLGYDLSRDEQMAVFDARIFAQGQLHAPLAPFWRDWYDALNPTFILPVGDREGLVSSYLPVNAAWRALVGLALPQSTASSLLVLIGGLALWRIAARLWPDSGSTRTAVLLLYAGSSQVIVMGSTAYAMTGHLAFNLVWLWLFLKRRPAGHAGALATGFLATGLHQPVFHPLFVLPFLDLLRREKRWPTLALYIAGYGAIGLFWLAWPNWISALGQHPVPSAANVAGIGFMDRLDRAFSTPSDVSLWLMGANLLRFFTWQHLLLLPLLLAGLRLAWREEPLCRALALGMAAMLALVTVVLPAQAHGWGYRYLHGFIGSAALIAGFGWHRLERVGLAPARAMRWATALSLAVLLPVHVWMARTMVVPYAEASARIAAIPADVVIIDDWPTPFAPDLVLNRADLSNRPIRLASSAVMADSLPALCAGRTLGFADAPLFAPIDRLFGVVVLTTPSDRQRQLQAAALAAGCRIIPGPQASQ